MATSPSCTTAAIPNFKNSSPSSSPMTLYEISYVDEKSTCSLVPVKTETEAESSKKKKIVQKPSKKLACEDCGLTFATEIRLKWHRSTHNPLNNRKYKRKPTKQIKQPTQQQQQPSEEPLKLGRSRKRTPKSYVETEEDIDEEPEQSPRTDKKKLTFICPACEFSTDNRNVMIEHFSETHCMKAAETKLRQVVSYIQRNDGDVADEVEQEDDVVDQQFEPVELTCSQCGFSSHDQDDLDFHTCMPTEQQMFSCPLCTYECLTRMGLQSHITRKHKPKGDNGTPRQCDECDFKCSNKNTLYSHKRKHRRGKTLVDATARAVKTIVEELQDESVSYYCNECDFSAKTKGALYLHIQRRHKTAEGLKQIPSRPEFYSCDQCDYTNKNKYEMKVHVIRKHTNEYNHECEICGKKYKIKGDLTNHIRFQHREQPIICDVCGKTCGNSNSLYVHQKFAHYKAEFECPICHRRMVSQANLDEHILKQHEQREDAVCEECGKTFTRQSRLKIHMRIHTGIKPHSCKICSKAFSRKTALRQHLLIHTGQRPYVCDICGKAFTQKPGLISHRKSHPGSHPPLPRVTIDHVLSDLLTEQC